MIPHEISLEWVYIPPFFFTVSVGFAFALLLTRILNKTGLSRYFWHPTLGFVAIWVICASLLGFTVFPP